MSPDIIIAVIGSVVAIIAGVVQILDFLKLGKQRKKGGVVTTPGERIQSSINNLRKISDEVDGLFQEIAADLKKRELALAELDTRNKELVIQEEGLRKRIDTLKDVPIEAAEYFQKINQQTLEHMDKRSGRRDFLFFVLGIVTSAVISIILRLSGLG